MLIVKPIIKHMVYRPRLGQICSKEDNPPNYFSKGALEEETLDSFILYMEFSLKSCFGEKLQEINLASTQTF
jgi:hypothetical protein